MKKRLVITLAVSMFVATTAGGAEGTPPQSQVNLYAADDGFTHHIQHNTIGSHNVLIIETHSSFGKESFGVAPEFVDDNVEVLNKWLKLTALAQERGDSFNKDMGMVKAFDFGLYNFWNHYEFVTSPTRNYHLKVTSGTKMLFKFIAHNPDEDATSGADRTRVMEFNQDQVKEIIQRLQDLKDGKLKTKADIGNVYN